MYGSRARRILMKSETATVAIRKWSPWVDWNLHLRIETVATNRLDPTATRTIREWFLEWIEAWLKPPFANRNFHFQKKWKIFGKILTI